MVVEARSPSGKAGACKAPSGGSIPPRASRFSSCFAVDLRNTKELLVKRQLRFLPLLSLLALTTLSFAQAPASFRVLFGLTDAASTRWDGTITAKEVGNFTTEGWRLEGVDNIDGNLFHFSTHPARLFNTPAGGAFVANGFIITADAVTDSSEFLITTAQGDFQFRASDVPYSNGLYKLGGRVYVDRVTAAVRLTNTPEEEDYPAIAAGANGDVWLAYVQFHHNPDHIKLRSTPKEDPKKYAQYKEPTGGDQIWAQKYSGGSWGQPIAVTKAGGDLYRAAVAVDGTGRAWVFWSENRSGNFDVFARALDASGAKDQVQISKDAGSDIDPVAATDANGKVWVAWQGWRDGRAAIFTAHQDGSGFTSPEKISNSSKNEWNPAIASDKTGRVSVAWDSYRNGNYDVYERTWSNSWGAEVPIAATARYEAYPSIAYDPNGRLWIAYEEGGRGWGKDFGAHKSPGIALYQGRAIRLRGLEPDGRLVALDASLDSKLVGTPTLRADRTGSQAEAESLDPNPDAALKRLPDAGTIGNPRASKNSLPRLTIDASGRFWLAFRTAHPIWWNPLGTVWTEELVSFDGKDWSKPIFLNHSDNLLDNRPALVSIANGKLLIVNSSDGRRDFKASQLASTPLGMNPDVPFDPYNNDLWSHEVDLGPANQVIPVAALNGVETKPDPPTVDAADASGIRAIRDFRGGPEGNFHILRGEFHRHSEISMDGGNDGTILEQWRYALDAGDLDWIGCCDHDNGGGREYTWWLSQKLTDIFHAPGKFVPLFSYERSVAYPEGHRNVLFAQRGVRTLPRLSQSTVSSAPNENVFAPAPDTTMLYGYLKEFNGVTASHTSATAMGTDWRNNDPNAEPIVEIYQGDRQNYEIPDGPRGNNEKDSIGGWRPKGYVSIALDKGYKLGFEASSDHISTHQSYANVFVKDVTRESLLEGFQKRHVYAATDNILADVESGSHLMGDEFSTSELPTIKVKLKGTSNFAKVVIVRDGKYVYSTAPNSQSVEFSWRDNQPNRGKVSYYYVRGEQDNGEIVWASPFWITYTGN
jgi:hypothetical protein